METMTYEKLCQIAPHLAGLCPPGNDDAATSIWASAEALKTTPHPRVPRLTPAQCAAIDNAE